MKRIGINLATSYNNNIRWGREMMLPSQSTAIRPLTTAHLAQTMTLLGMTTAELRQKIELALSSNPALELVEERHCPTCHRPLSNSNPCPMCSQPQSSSIDQPIVFVSPRDDFYYNRAAVPLEDEVSNEELAAESTDLATYVLRQIAPELQPEDRFIAAHILTSLDEDGLLRTPIIEIARYHHVPIDRIENVLHLIQHADPIGVGSATPQEAMLVQLDFLNEIKPIPPLTEEAVRVGMDLLSHRQYVELGRLLHLPTSQVKEIAHFISENLNPYPARAHWGDIRQAHEQAQAVYYHPDIIISCLNDQPDSPLVVEVISPLAGKLRVNPLFKEAIHQAPAEKSDEWQSDLDQASLLVKCLQQRNNTLVRLMQRLATLQREFILNGDAHLNPYTRSNLAEELDVHESTISRAVSNKTVQLPNGRIIPLSKLFDRSLHIRTALRQIVSQEGKPLTDTQIASQLMKQGYPVARRTVAKYRAMEGILPAHLRESARA